MNLGAVIVAAALFKSQIKALVNGDDVIIGPLEPEPEPVCPHGWFWSKSQNKCIRV